MIESSRRTLLRSGAALGVGALFVTSIAEAAISSATSRAALATSTGCATLTKSETQGPFWVDEKLNRSDVRADSETGAVQNGVPLTLTIKLQDAGASCAPQAGAYVDIWHANAQGAYSDVSGSGNPNNVGVDWLRGYQVSDSTGSVTFTTIVPGWYVGRTLHIHFRVRLTLDASTTVNFTSQLFFDETTTNAVIATSAYQKSGTRTTNGTDNLYDASLLLPVTGDTTNGYAGTFTVNLDFGDGTTSGTSGTDAVVDASLTGVTVVRKRRKRTVKVRLRAGEQVTGVVRLVRHDDVLASRTTGWLAAGDRVVKLKVPRGVKAGSARVQVTLADTAGNAWIAEKTVTVPSR